jgi:2-hydroxychromene-2-carboxylate isomerase
MNTSDVQFLFDFGSPNAYLCHKMIPALEARNGVAVTYIPILLGGLFKLANNRSPMEAFGQIPNKIAYERLEMRRFIVRHGLTKFTMNSHFPVNTLKIMRGAVAARELGCYKLYIDAMFVAMWERGLNMDDQEQIVAVLQAAGIDSAAILATSQEADIKAALLQSTQASYERGAFGSPTFFVGNEMFFGKERLRQVEDEISKRASQ